MIAMSNSTISLFTIQTHQSSFSNEDVILSKDLFGEYIQIGDFIRITCIDNATVDSNHHQSSIMFHNSALILKVTSMQNGRVEISINKQVADALNIKPYSRVMIDQVNPRDYEVDFVELTFKRQFLQRGNMWRFRKSMFGRSVYMKQQTTVGGVLTQIQEVTRRGVPQASGIISENTRFIFRSRSTRIIWLVQISIEMWQFDEQGDLYFEKFLRKFVSPVLDIWKSLGVSHSLTIVFFARSIEHIHTPIVPPVGTPSDAPQQFTSTIRHKDYFKIVIENVADIDKQIHLRNLKKEFWAFPKSVGWDIGKEGISTKKEGYTDYTPSPSSSSSSLQSESSQSYITRQPSEAGSGNFLESINTALNLLNLHYMDRDLSRTGNSIVVISAGCGFYHVTPDISLVTKQRMMDGGIGIDFISLSSPPLHHVPLFHVHCTQEGLSDFYDFPYWMNVCYVDCERDSSATVHATEYVGRSGKNKASNHNQYRSMMRSIHDNSTRYINKAFGQRLYPQPFSNNVNVPLVRLSEFVTSLSSTTTSSGDGKLSCEFCSAESEQHIKEKQAKLPHVTEWGYIDVNALEIQLRAEAECNSCQHRVVGTAGGTSQPNTNTSSTNAALINVPSSSAALPYIVNRNIMMQSHALHQDIFKHSQSAKKNSTSNHTHNHNHDHSHQNIDHTHTDHSHSNTHGTDTLSRSHGNKHTDPSVGTSMHQRAHNHSRSRSGDGGDFGPNSIPGHDDGEDMGPLRRFRSTSMVASSHGSDTESRFNEAFKFHDPHINRNSIERGPTATTESVDIFSCLDSEIFSDPNVLLQAMEQYDNNVFTSKAKLNKRFTGIATTLSLKKQHQNMEKMSTSIFHQESYNPILANNLGDYFSDDEAKQQYTTGNFNDYRSSSHLLSGNFTPSPNTPYSPIPITRKTSSAQIPSILTFPRFLSSDITNLEEYILSSIQIINALEDSMMDRYLFSYQFYDHFHTLVVNMEIAVSVQPHVDDTKNENVLIFPVEESRPIRHKLCAVYQYCDGTISASMPFIQNQVSNADIPGSDKKGGHNLIMEQMRNVILNPDYFLTQVIGIEYLFDKSPIFNTTTTGTGATAATSGIADYGSRSYHLRFPTVDTIMEVESQENSSHHNNKDNDNDTAPVHSYSHSYNHSHLHNDTQSNIHRNDNKKTDLSFDDNDLLLNREIVLDELQPSPVSRLHEHGIPIMSSSPSPSPSPARSRHSRPRGVQQRSRSRDGPDLMSKSPSSVVAVSPVSSSFYFPTNMNATGGSGPPRHSTSGPTSGSLSRSYKEKQKFDMEHFNLNQYKGALPQATSGLNTQSDGLQPIFRPITDTLGQAQMTKSTTGTNSEPPTPARLQGNQIQSQSHSQPHMESQEYRQAIEEYRERRIQVNPFKKDDSREFFKLRTHNRLRWSHVFPSGGLHDYSSEFYGLNIKSLCQPAVLPLSTSFLCSVKSLNEDYHDQGVYSLVFDSSVSKEGAEDCVLEMVCQRLSQEFQLVEGIDMTPYRTYLANHNIGSLTKGKSDVEELYILSMGHRIHFLLYNRIQREVKVSRIKLMNASSDPSDKSGGVRTRYEYELWVPPTMRFHVMTQNFFQYPVPEYSWNTADAIITGYNNLEPPFAGLKPKTLHFVIIPEAAAQTGEAEEEAYFAKLDKLIQLLRSKAKTQSHSSLVLEYMKKSDPHFSADGSPDTPLVSSTGGSNGSSSSGGSNKAVTKLWLPTPGVEASKCITLCTDKRARSDRVFHFDFYWIACDSWLMEELIGTLFIRCKNWGLRMAQTPEYFHAPIMQIHPYRCQPYFQFSNRFERDPMVALSKVAYIQKHCFEAVDSEWIRDADQVTEWVTSAFIDAKKKLSQLLNVDNSSTTTATTPASASTSTSGSTTASAMKKSNSQSALSVAVAAEIAAGNLQPSSSNVTTPVNSSDHATSKVAMSPVNTVNGLQSNDSATRQITNTATAISATTDVLVLSPVKSPKAAVAVVQPSSPALHSESIRTPVSQQQSQMTSQSQLIRGGLSFNLFRGATKKYTGVSTLNIPERKSTGYMPNQSKDSFKTTENKLNFMSKNETQYFHRNGHSCVRFGPNSFVWMFSIGGKISDLSTNVDKEKVLVSEKMRQFFDRCKTVDVCVDILYDLIDSVCGDVRNNLKI